VSRADLTGLLQAWSRGEEQALDELAPLVHRELREMARRILAGERRDGGLQPTELVHESYLRLLEWQAVQWQNRAHFFATTARMMRRVLVDLARARQTAKRGGGARLAELDPDSLSAPGPAVDVASLAEALDALGAIEPRASQVVEMRFFGGFTVAETAEALAISPRTVINDWNAARAWLFSRLSGQDGL
jgi:RNA polymerase sigma factor (TIGR02999 family)